MRALTEAEFNEWKSHPGTQAVMEILSSRREALRQAWEGGSFTDYDKEGTVLVNVGNMGTCKGYAFVEELTYDQLLGELDEQRIGAETPGSSSAD